MPLSDFVYVAEKVVRARFINKLYRLWTHYLFHRASCYIDVETRIRTFVNNNNNNKSPGKFPAPDASLALVAFGEDDYEVLGMQGTRLIVDTQT